MEPSIVANHVNSATAPQPAAKVVKVGDEQLPLALTSRKQEAVLHCAPGSGIHNIEVDDVDVGGDEADAVEGVETGEAIDGSAAADGGGGPEIEGVVARSKVNV